MEKENICPDCGKPIEEKMSADKKIGLAGIVVLLIILIVGAYFMYKNHIGAAPRPK